METNYKCKGCGHRITEEDLDIQIKNWGIGEMDIINSFGTLEFKISCEVKCPKCGRETFEYINL